MLVRTTVGTTTAAIYARVSTTGQREDATSLETQVDACRAHAAQAGLQVADEVVFAEDWPGTSLARPALDQIRQLAQDHAISALVCYSTDRLSRDPIHLAILAQELEQRGCRLELVTEPVDGSPEGQLLQFVRGWAGKLEHAKISERTMRGKREAARRGCCRRASRFTATATSRARGAARLTMSKPRSFEQSTAGTPRKASPRAASQFD